MIKINANARYATNSPGIVLIEETARRARVPLQLFVVRNDSSCGSTIGPMLSAALGTRTLDLGNPQLSMHSIRETGGIYDVDYAYVFPEFMFPLLNPILSLETCLGSIYSLDVLSSSPHPLKPARLTPTRIKLFESFFVHYTELGESFVVD